MKDNWILAVGLLLIAAALFYSGTAAAPEVAAERAHARLAPATVTFLPPEVSRNLDFTPITRPGPQPLVVGTFWDCKEASGGPGGEVGTICDIVWVFCTDDQESCVQVGGL